jgi:hypothetical protein
MQFLEFHGVRVIYISQEDGQPAAAILAAIRQREARIAALEAEEQATKPLMAPATIDPERVRQELADFSALLGASVERARAELKKLHFQVHLFPVFPADERRYLRAVASADLRELTGVFSLCAALWRKWPRYSPSTLNRWREAGRSRVAPTRVRGRSRRPTPSDPRW